MRVRATSILFFAALSLMSCQSEAPQPATTPGVRPGPAPATPVPGGTAPAATAPGAAPARPAGPGVFAEFPDTAEAIRASSPTGRACRFRVIDPNGETLTRMEFRDADESGVIVHSSVTRPTGESVGETQDRATWSDLVMHAAYPAAFTTITPVEVTVEAGTFQARLYEVDEPTGAGKLMAWFADDLAGPPVKLEQYQGGEVVVSMELIEHSLPESG